MSGSPRMLATCAHPSGCMQTVYPGETYCPEHGGQLMITVREYVEPEVATKISLLPMLLIVGIVLAAIVIGIVLL